MDKVRKIEMDYSEKWGKDVEEAVRLALADLDASRDQVDVVVLEEPSKGFFGIGSRLAKVRVQKKQMIEEASGKETDRKEKVDQKKEANQNKADNRKEEDIKEDLIEEKESVFVKDASVKDENETKESAEKPAKKEIKKKEKDFERGKKTDRNQRTASHDRKPSDSDDSRFTIRKRPTDLVEMTEHSSLTFLRDVIDKMGLSLTVRAYQNADSIYLDMDGKDSGTIIGKRGQTLDAIQYLTSLVANKDSESYIRVVVDAENYRDKREKTLEQLADRLADKVKRSGKSVRLEPMNPYERKIIHAALQRNPNVATRSEGEEPYRRVIIELK